MKQTGSFSLGGVVPCSKMIKLVKNKTSASDSIDKNSWKTDFGKKVNCIDKSSQNDVPCGNPDPVWLYFVQMFSWTIANPVSCFPSCVSASLLSMNFVCSYKNSSTSRNAINRSKRLHWKQKGHISLFLMDIYVISIKKEREFMVRLGF